MRSKAVCVERVVADISGLLLADVPSLRSAGTVVAFSKHACGPATDAILRCVGAFDSSQNDAMAAMLVLAPCCHHRCTWDTYAGKPFFASIGLTSEDFATAVAISAWATLGEIHEAGSQHNEEGHAAPPQEDELAGPCPTRKQKVWLGQRCKRLLDLGRVHALRSRNQSLHCKFVDHCSSSIM
eukprot:TRINITY_DN5999_c6_g1_i1.p1 TRINITY_DN5999_c6_g1~~TRINITY_DN5999_c6_g1_i1.p1  ORF type:complete len:183 (+),score=27.89 TRINITY_DN5999_c6_g1_i1:252-800(+)